MKTFLIAVLLLLGANLSSQGVATFGVKAGINLATLSGYEDSNLQLGLNAGVSLDYAFSQKEDWFILTGLEYVTKGTKLDEITLIDPLGKSSEVELSYNLGYLQLPLHVGYRSEGSKLIFHAGPYVAYGISGKFKASTTGFPNSSINAFRDDGFKKFDFGAGIGAKACFWPIEIGVGWDFGLTNINQVEGKNIKTQNGYLTVGYNF